MIRDIGVQSILNVDLSSSSTWAEKLDQGDILTFLGGRGINAKLLYERVPKGTDPLGPDNVLVFGSGTLTGTSAPSSGRTSITCKGPATGLYLKVSAGGHLGAELKYAGYDYVAIHGKAEKPVLLSIRDESVELHDARHLWGMGTRDADGLIRDQLGDDEIEVAVIGPAGENGVLFSCIIVSQYNSASRGGVGAVMGSKNLKALAVRGKGGLRVAEAEDFFKLASGLRIKLADDEASDGLYRWGTSGGIVADNEAGFLTSRNFGRVTIDGAERISGQYLEEEGYLTGRESCFSCSTACHRFVCSKEHRYGEVRDSGPEYEAMAALGAACGITDTEAVLAANHLCNDYGLDVISTGHTLAWAMECYEGGILDDRQTDGLELQFGNAESQLEQIRRIAFREGVLGDLLANGTKRASEEVGHDSWKWAMQAKGLEHSAVDTRMAKGYALAFAVNPRGPDHLMTECLAEFGYTQEARALVREITGDEANADPTSLEKRAEIVRWHEDCYAASDALGFCVFASTSAYAVNPTNMARLFAHALGVGLTEQELMTAGRRIVTLERCFNVREGARRQQDVLPWRMMNEPVRDGPNKGLVTDLSTLDCLLDEYYQMHGWDGETGVPKPATLESLGLGVLCEDVITG